ncbi:hypothetical protein, partial [Amedibacterium intestinale]|uniref:hypothetical protein n=1 Tax=Amedibacterium intestinale TaxID=2583452 RepID=UPI0022E3BE0E
RLSALSFMVISKPYTINAIIKILIHITSYLLPCHFTFSTPDFKNRINNRFDSSSKSKQGFFF